MVKKYTIILILFINIILITGCNNIKDKKIKEKEVVEDEYIEIIPDNAIKFIENLDNSIILSTDEIKEYNKKIKEKTTFIFDLNSITNLTKEDVLNYINSYTIPKLPKYNGNNKVTQNDIKVILDNRNIEGIKNNIEIKKGIIVKRSNLKSFPTDINFFSRKGINNFDSLQETELTINTPILIVHESKDKMWNFVISPIYVGWVKNDTIALATDDDINYFINNTSFGVITEASLKIDDLILDMGVKLPYIGVSKNNYQFVIPVKGDNNYAKKKVISIPRTKAHIGYLPYTKRNVIIQAFKYEGMDYSWSGMNESVDCSSYILNVYKTFGFTFPRNTVNQRDSVGNITWLNGKTNTEKLSIISNNKVSLIYQIGHVMLYLGTKEDKHYIIHASGDDMKIVVTDLNSRTYLSKIDRVITIP